MNRMRISVVMSTYNGEKYLEKQVESIFSQDWPINELEHELSLFIRDDGSTDSTLSIIERLSSKYPIALAKSSGMNLGYAKSFLKVIEEAGDADWYVLCDQDDIWGPQKISSIFPEMRLDSTTPTLIYTDMVHFGKSNVRQLERNGADPQLFTDYRKALFEPRLNGNMTTINHELRKLVLEIWLKDGASEQCKAHDTFILRVASLFGNVKYVNVKDPSKVMLYRVEGQNLSADKKNTLFDKFTFFLNRSRVFNERASFCSFIANINDLERSMPQERLIFVKSVGKLSTSSRLYKFVHGFTFVRYQKNRIFKFAFIFWLASRSMKNV
ncbi:glycosyltransferase [Lactobacillus paracasei]|nr:glycosyltransferase [Lacticaseibacillus paracasei]